MTQPMNPWEGQLIQMPEQLFMDFFPVAEPVAQPITLQKVQPVGNENNEDFKKRLFNRLIQPYKPASEPTSEQASEPGSEQATKPTSEQAFEPVSQQASESASLPALEAIASESSVTTD